MRRTALLASTLLAGTALLCACTTPHPASERVQHGAGTVPPRPAPLPPPPDSPPIVFDDPGAVHAAAPAAASDATAARAMATMQRTGMPRPRYAPAPAANTETYASREDNPVHRTAEQPVSTFSVDVDTGSYSNVRRMLTAGIRPPADAVRAEEFINYFDYGHPAPTSREVPFRVSTELAPAPWNAQRQLLMIGIKGYDVRRAELPPANLVLLIDTSGSMDSPDKLPLLKRAMGLLARQLRSQDTVAIVAYAGSAGLVLPPTAGNRQGEILAALERLDAGGSTNGGAGIQLAYAMARQGYIDGGVNRVLLATDGDFNVGTVDQRALETLVADQRGSGIALTTLGFGTGNYNDALAERLADLGNGNHAYIDTALEARRVLVEAMGSTLMTIAGDVKVQVEFNPAAVAEYRLIGYENRLLRREDFANDKVDAGDIGAGHEVTALYEITPVGSAAQRLAPLRYAGAAKGRTSGDTSAVATAGEIAHLRLRYKQPGSDRSELIETPILRSQARARASGELQFAAAVAGFADALRGGAGTDGWGWEGILAGARQSRGEGDRARREEFVTLVEQARDLTAGEPAAALSP